MVLEFGRGSASTGGGDSKGPTSLARTDSAGLAGFAASSISILASLGLVACGAPREGLQSAGIEVPEVFVEADERSPFAESISGTTLELSFAPIPGGTLGGDSVAPFYLSATEVSWEMYLALVFEAEDAEQAESIDGFARPSKPYISMDRGFGQRSEPVISISLRGAQTFCEWLTRHTGRLHRLPTEQEWEFAARAGKSSTWSTGEDEAGLDSHAWYARNSGGRTRPVGSGEPNAFGLYDVHGNAAEWVSEGWLVGGAFNDAATELAFGKRKDPSPTWNASDPQIPKSTWWLADAPFTGMRVVCERAPGDVPR